MTLKNSADHLWIIDTGATDHMVCSISFLTTITSIIAKQVRLPNGNLVAVTHTGTVKLSTTLTLTNVLCVPSFSFNLIYVRKLINVLHCCLIFLAKFYFIQQLSGWKMIGLGREKGGLYHLILHNLGDFCDSSVPVLVSPFAQIKPHFNTVVSDSVVLNSVNSVVEVSANVWHSRLGHLSDSRIQLLNNVLPGYSSVSNKDCFVCPLAKQHKFHFQQALHILLIFFI
jgi:hypothetical protein